MKTDRFRYITLGVAVALVFLLICAGSYLALQGRDYETTVAPLVGFATPTIVALLTAAGIFKGQAESKSTLEEVKHKINGNVTELLQNHADLIARMNLKLEQEESKDDNEHNH